MISKIIISFILIELLFALILLLQCLNKITNDADYLIILGHKLNNNKPSNVLIERLECALKYLRSNNKTTIVLSGGITKNNSLSEAQVMKEYLIQNGINENRIILEDKSIDTVENIANCLNYIDKNSKVVLISSNYHILRARMICNLLGLKVSCIGSYTPIVEFIKHIFIEEIFIFIHYFRIKN